MKKNEGDYDDLKKIKGIAETRERALQEDLNVYCYQDLADMNIKLIEDLFKKRGERVSGDLIKSWISEAKLLATNSNKEQQSKRSKFLNKFINKKNKGEDTNWQSIATFIVEYQEQIVRTGETRNRTTIHYMQNDTGASWPGFEHLKQCEWMKKQINEPPIIKENSITVIQKDKVFIWIENILFHQSDMVSEDIQDKINAPVLRSKKPFDIEIIFSIKGDNISNLVGKNELEFQANCIAENSLSKENINISTTSHLMVKSNEENYQIQFKDIELDRGEYRFWSAVRLDMNNTVPHFFEIPVLNVQ